MTDTRRIVSVSSGLGSAYVWKLLCDRHGPENVTGVFTDVNGEHPDNYRFLAEVQYHLGSRLVKVTNDGKTIWDVFLEKRFLGNTRVDLCSRILKREAMLSWLRGNVDPTNTVISLGIDWTEVHRFDRAHPRWKEDGFTIDAPMCEKPYRDKLEAQAWLDSVGIRRPALYDLGFGHANCGGGCVKAGVRQFKQLLAADRNWYINWWEAGEERCRAELGDVAILRDRRMVPARAWECGHPPMVDEDDGYEEPEHRSERDLGRWVTRMVENTRPLPLRELREQLERTPSLFDDAPEEPGCGVCFLEPDDEDAMRDEQEQAPIGAGERNR